MSRELADHLKDDAEIGVTGVSRDPNGEIAGVNQRTDAGHGDPSSASPASLAPAQAGGSEDIRTEIGPACTRCKLCTLGRSQIVFGVGNPKAA